MKKKRSNSTNSTSGVRKGAWTAEEDFLLRKCIEKYGEGKWHQVPLKAGLNRCRKSCRLRWLNYLRPDIKRGCFTEDEDDLLIRLHKLLGNRWSLIAGRLPGRTANDVKNYWNTRMRKKLVMPREDEKLNKITKVTIIKPRPRTFSRNIPPSVEGKPWKNGVEKNHLLQPNTSQLLPTSLPPPANDDNNMEWWANLFAQLDQNNGEATNSPLSFNFPDELMNPTNEKQAFDVIEEMVPTNEIGCASNLFKEDDQKDLSSELFVDIDMWINL